MIGIQAAEERELDEACMDVFCAISEVMCDEDEPKRALTRRYSQGSTIKADDLVVSEVLEDLSGVWCVEPPPLYIPE